MKLAFYILLMMPVETFSQTLTETSKIIISASGEQDVILYAAHDCDHCYYYLPSSLRISARNGVPEASLLVWTDEKTSKTLGGVLHLLVEWGLKAGYEKKVQKQLRAKYDSLGVIMGPAMVTAENSHTVIGGNDRLSVILKQRLQNSPSIPTTPGAKMALSFRFTENEIEEFLDYRDHPDKTKTNLRITYSYAVQTLSGQERAIRTTLRLPFGQVLKTIKSQE